MGTQKHEINEVGVTKGAAEASVVTPIVKSENSGRANPEVSDKPRRRRFSAEYKLKVLREADRCTKSGELGALIRREGIYSSSLSAWRRQRESYAIKSDGVIYGWCTASW